MKKSDFDDKFQVALTKLACPVCGTPQNGDLVMNTRLTTTDAEKVKAMHQQVVGYMKEPCDKCKELMAQGFLFIGVVAAKTDDPKNPYRSGNQWVVTHDYARRLYDGKPPEKGVAFIDVLDAQSLGFPGPNLEA